MNILRQLKRQHDTRTAEGFPLAPPAKVSGETTVLGEAVGRCRCRTRQVGEEDGQRSHTVLQNCLGSCCHPLQICLPSGDAPVTEDLATVPGGDGLLAECTTAKPCCATSAQTPEIAIGSFATPCSATLCSARPPETPETVPSSCKTMPNSYRMYGCSRAIPTTSPCKMASAAGC